jgi:biotin transport system substrate-specific component
MNRSVTAPGLITIDRFWTAETQVDRATRAIVLVAVGTLLLWASARVQIPLLPVKASLQTLVVMLIGASYGARLGAITVVAYLAEGVAGMPVFQSTPENGIGLLYMAGPTGGYLIGFIALAAIVGFAVERGWGRSIPVMIGAILIANIVMYTLGVGWLARLIGVEKAVAFGLMPFIVADAVKILIVVGVTFAASKATSA